LEFLGPEDGSDTLGDRRLDPFGGLVAKDIGPGNQPSKYYRKQQPGYEINEYPSIQIQLSRTLRSRCMAFFEWGREWHSGQKDQQWKLPERISRGLVHELQAERI